MTNPSQNFLDEMPPPQVDPGTPVFRALDLLLRSIVAALAFPGDIPDLLIVERLAAAGASVRRALQVVQPASYVEDAEAEECGSIHCIDSLSKEAAVEVYSMKEVPWSVGDVADVARHWKLAARDLHQAVDLWRLKQRSEQRAQRDRDFGFDGIVKTLQPHFPMLLDMYVEYVQGPERSALSVGREMVAALTVLGELDAELHAWANHSSGEEGTSARSGEDIATLTARVSEAGIALVQHIDTLGTPKEPIDLAGFFHRMLGAGAESVSGDLAAFEAALTRVAGVVHEDDVTWKVAIGRVFPEPYAEMLTVFAIGIEADAVDRTSEVWALAAPELSSALLALQQMDNLGPFQPLDVLNPEGE